MLTALLVMLLIGFHTPSKVKAQISQVNSPSPAALAYPGTIVHFPHEITGSIYDVLLSLAVANRVPLGIIRDKPSESKVCEITISIKPGDMTLLELTAILNARLSDRVVLLINGTVNFQPKQLPQSAISLLDTRIPEFHSILSTHNAAGVSLWFYVRSVIAPGEATAYAGGGGFSSERINVESSKAHTVKQNLNLIVTRGLGGAWVLESSDVVKPVKQIRMPFFIYDYNADEEGLKHALSCQR